ncbi:tyrosine-protein phosphatase [Actinomadura rayongensis]|uniref:Protein-tyrosine-phosphatase n=1 Tax=Actinomadura rayongensis TaxID=1429076 RepID=A0A6I4W5Q5_9ACTN|nr:tyrosine-protein phosphatase [Actinomadura rayongensis]MXQ66049.1 protein-tyrosine-phosphatase [Actinomadura rayongensis]
MRSDDEFGFLRLDGAANVRDLGGRPVPGGAVARGRLLRADALNALSESDLERLAGVRTVIDFRSDHEVGTNGADRLPDGADLVHLPIDGGDLEDFYKAVTAGDPLRQREVFGGGRTERVLVGVNRNFVADDEQRAAFATALRLVADAGRLPLIFHCTAGKDRTGWMAAIVLTILGVPRADIMADYLRSNEYHRERWKKLLDHLGRTGQMEEPELLLPLLEQRPEYLEAAFSEATARYGSFAGFLADGLGADEELLAAVRDGLTA